MLNTARCKLIFISDSLWWDSVLGQRTEDFLASGKNEVMIASLDSLQRVDGESDFKLLSLLIFMKYFSRTWIEAIPRSLEY